MSKPPVQPAILQPAILRAAILGAAVVLAAHLSVASAASADGAFRDGFEAFDPTRWYVSDGWSNGDWQACTWSRRMVDVQDGSLRLRLAPAAQGSDDYLCSEVQSQAELGHGTFEARIRTDRASGVNAAFFTYIGPVHGRTHEEIDVEILTRDTGAVEFNTYRDGVPAGGGRALVDPPTDAAFHTYAFVWEPRRLRWFLDGVQVHEATGPDLPQPPQKMMLSHWNTRTLTDWMGPFADGGRPLTMDVDWVAFTPLGEPCGFPESLVCALEAAP